MSKKIFFIAVALLAIAVGLYPGIYFIVDREFGLLQSKTQELLADISWNIGFYSHIILSGIALLIGWVQFNTSWRTKYLQVHRQIGKIYVVCALLGSISGFFIAMYATGGIIAVLGFIGLAISWFYTTLRAFIEIRQGNIAQHQKMMIYSYATCFAAVTLRIYLPLLLFSLDFNSAYRIVAWLCWIPNLLIASLIVKRFSAPLPGYTTRTNSNLIRG